MTTSDQAAIRARLDRYAAALRAADTETVMTLYARDGVFMGAFSPSAVGASAIRGAYQAIFQAIRLAVEFDIAEIVQVAPGWAFARTNSAGTVTVQASGASSAEANQELFLFQKDADDAWKIARYSFSPTSPQR